jgi:hypothetical protein
MSPIRFDHYFIIAVHQYIAMSREKPSFGSEVTVSLNYCYSTACTSGVFTGGDMGDRSPPLTFFFFLGSYKLSHFL